MIVGRVGKLGQEINKKFPDALERIHDTWLMQRDPQTKAYWSQSIKKIYASSKSADQWVRRVSQLMQIDLSKPKVVSKSTKNNAQVDHVSTFINSTFKIPNETGPGAPKPSSYNNSAVLKHISNLKQQQQQLSNMLQSMKGGSVNTQTQQKLERNLQQAGTNQVALKQALNSEQARVQALQKEQQNLMSQIGVLSKRNTASQNNTQKKNAMLLSLAAEKSKLENELQSQIQAVQQHAQIADQLQEQEEKLKAAVALAQNSANQAAQQAQNLQKRHSNQQQISQNLQKQLNMAKQALNLKDQRLKELEDSEETKAVIQEQMETLQQKIREQQETIQSKQHNIDVLKDSGANDVAAKQKFVSQIQELQQQLEQRGREVQQASQTRNNALSNIQAVQAQYQRNMNTAANAKKKSEQATAALQLQLTNLTSKNSTHTATVANLQKQLALAINKQRSNKDVINRLKLQTTNSNAAALKIKANLQNRIEALTQQLAVLSQKSDDYEKLKTAFGKQVEDLKSMKEQLMTMKAAYNDAAKKQKQAENYAKAADKEVVDVREKLKASENRKTYDLKASQNKYLATLRQELPLRTRGSRAAAAAVRDANTMDKMMAAVRIIPRNRSP